MNDLLSRILISVATLPLATALLITIGFALRGTDGFTTGGIIAGSLVLLSWLSIWRGAVRWTPRRRWLTFAAIPAAIIPALVPGIMLHYGDGLPFIPIAATAIWLILAVLIWRETPAERAERLQASAGKALFCPKCNYNMTGLYEARCPECGERFTLDQLMAAQQRNRLAEELSPPRQETPGPAK